MAEHHRERSFGKCVRDTVVESVEMSHCVFHNSFEFSSVVREIRNSHLIIIIELFVSFECI